MNRHGQQRLIMTPDQKKYLLANHETKTLTQMGRYLNVSDSKVASWLLELGIKKKRVLTPHFEEGEFFEHDASITTI